MDSISLKRNIKEIYLEFSRFALRNYPHFITRSSPDNLKNFIPVFCFHSVSHDDLSEKLIYLKENGYRLITIDEFLPLIKGKKPSPPKPVMLTFDDGHISLWSVAYPLLKEFGFSATAFIIPRFIEDSNHSKKKKGRNIKEFDTIPYSMITWQQAQKMQESGVISIQSHSFSHQSHFISSRIVDYFSPAERHTSQWLELPVWRWRGKDIIGRIPPAGMPIYRAAPRMSGIPRYFEDEVLTQRCTDFVTEAGDTISFQQGDWKRRLAQIVKDYKIENKINERFENTEETAKAIKNDLLLSNEMIEEYIPGHRVFFLSYPWGIGSQLAVDQSKKIGLKGNFWIVGPNKKANYITGDPFFINRVKDDYIFRLPGKGRKSLWEIFRMKLQRRMKGQDIY